MLSIESGGSARKPKYVAVPPPFCLAVDHQIKSGYDTFEKAEKAALAIKREHPRLLVSVYETSLCRHIPIEEPQLVAAPNGKREAPARHPARATTH